MPARSGGAATWRYFGQPCPRGPRVRRPPRVAARAAQPRRLLPSEERPRRSAVGAGRERSHLGPVFPRIRRPPASHLATRPRPPCHRPSGRGPRRRRAAAGERAPPGSSPATAATECWWTHGLPQSAACSRSVGLELVVEGARASARRRRWQGRRPAAGRTRTSPSTTSSSPSMTWPSCRATGWRRSRGTVPGSTASASTPSGGSVSDGPPTGPMMPRSWMIARGREKAVVPKSGMRPVHPGEILRDELSRELSQSNSRLRVRAKITSWKWL